MFKNEACFQSDMHANKEYVWSTYETVLFIHTPNNKWQEIQSMLWISVSYSSEFLFQL